MCSPQSIIFTAVTNGRKAYCNYSYRYWGHLEVVSPHWKTELLRSHEGQFFITWSSVKIHRRTLTSNWMHRHKEATKGHFCILEKKEAKEKKSHNNPALGMYPCSIYHCPLFLLSVWCAFLLCKAFASQKRSSLQLWRATFTAGLLTDVWARHADGCTHINTHACIRA